MTDTSAQYPDLQTNGTTLRDNVTNSKVRAIRPQAGTQSW
jgi:hypothetical protein